LLDAWSLGQRDTGLRDDEHVVRGDVDHVEPGTVRGLVVILLGVWIVVGARMRSAGGGAELPRTETEVDAREGP